VPTISTRTAGAVVAAVAFVGGLLLNWWNVVNSYPTGDEFSMIAESSDLSLAWFTSGTSHYSIAYPEYWSPINDFLRPVHNIIYFVFSGASGYREQLIAVNHGALALSTGAVYLLSRTTGNSASFALVMAACAFLAPAFWGSAMSWTPAAAFDGVAAVQTVAAVWLASTGRWAVALAILAVAVFTKETSLPIIAAVAVYHVLAGRLVAGVATAGIVVSWAAIRFAIFGASVGVYVFFSGTTIARAVVALLLPVTYGDYVPIRKILAGDIPDGLLFAIIIGNVFVLLSAALAAAPSLGRRFRERSGVVTDRVALLELSAICVIFGGLFFIIISGGTRYSYVFYLSFLMMLIATPPGAWRTAAAGVLLSTALLSTALYVAASERGRPMAEFHFNAARELMQTLRTIEAPGTTYVSNDFVVNYSKMSNAVKVAGATLKAERGSSIDVISCGVADLSAIKSTMVVGASGEISLTTTLPPCAGFKFEAAAMPKLLEHLQGTRLSRNDEISYEFPELAATPSGISDWGSVMTLTVRGGALLYYDFQQRQWVFADAR
jgi:hypothetical protein